ncbi:hypothetical protein ACFE04_020053 [Oxalis oulophora]
MGTRLWYLSGRPNKMLGVSQARPGAPWAQTVRQRDMQGQESKTWGCQGPKQRGSMARDHTCIAKGQAQRSKLDAKGPDQQCTKGALIGLRWMLFEKGYPNWKSFSKKPMWMMLCEMLGNVLAIELSISILGGAGTEGTNGQDSTEMMQKTDSGIRR